MNVKAETLYSKYTVSGKRQMALQCSGSVKQIRLYLHNVCVVFITEARPEQEGDRGAGTEALERDQHWDDGAASAPNHQNRNPQDGHVHHQPGGARCK